MIKAILLVFDPVNTWDDIVQDRRELPFMVAFFLLPLLAVVCAVEGYGMMNWGKWLGALAGLKKFTVTEVVVYEILQLLVSLVAVFVGAKLLKALGETFHGRHTYTQAFRAVAYGLSPMFTLRLLDAFPSMPWWVTFTIGMMLSVAIMYHGVPRVMEPDPPHAFGLYLTSSLLLAMTTGLGRFLTAWWAAGRFGKVQVVVQSYVAHLITQLHL